jgi:hypothetical protein
VRKLLAAGLVLITCVAARAAYAPHLVCHFADPEIRESSGIATASRSDAYFWTHNDSGDTARIFAVDRQGRTLATLRLPGAKNIDWEAIARTRGPGGESVLLLADIGDNNAKRTEISLYRIPEPTVAPNRTGQTGATGTADRFDLRYPDGPKDCETLLAAPDGRLYLVTKNLAGSQVFAAPHPLVAGKPNLLHKIGEINFAVLPTSARALKGQVSRLLATDGAISPDGRRLVVRTYVDAYEWDLPNGDVAAALKTKPRHIPLPETRQGEGITYTRDGSGFLTTSEGEGAPVYELTDR